MCPDIAEPVNGQINFSLDVLAPFDFGTVATYSCDTGFGLNGGDVTRMCEGDGSGPIGEWSGDGSSPIGEWSGDGSSPIGEWSGDGSSQIGEWSGDGSSPIGEWSGTAPICVGES